MPGSDDRRRRLRLPAPGLLAAPPLTASRPAAEGDPVSGAPGWRVTRRAAPPASDEVQARPRAAGPAAPQPVSDPLGMPARSPRRVGPPERRRRGISFLALAAAAAVVVFVLGLAAFDMRMPEWPQAWPERPAMNGKSGQTAGGAQLQRPG